MATRTGILDGTEWSEDVPLGLLLLAAAIAAVLLSPLLWVVSSALDASDWVGLATAPRTLSVLVNSGLLVGAVTSMSMLVGVPAAYLTVRTDLPARRAFTILLALPLVIPSYIGAFAFLSAFGPRGLLHGALEPLGVGTLPSIYGLAGTTVVLTLYTYPYVYITSRASLLSMDARLVDAARTLSHSRWAAFRRITWPQIRPAVAAGALLVALYTLSDFGTPAVMRFDVFTRIIFVEYNDILGGGRDLASLLSLQLIAVTVVILAVESRVRGSGVRTTASADGMTVELGRWRWPAVLACLLVVSVALLLPLAILGVWYLNGSASASLEFRLGYVLNSVTIAGVAALLCGVLALPIAYLSSQTAHPAAWIVERASYVGYAVPGVVMGLALVFFGARYGGVFYRQGLILLPLLVFAYVVRFLPQAIGSSRAAFLGVSGSLEEAARTLGHSPGQAFRRVTLPLVLPGIVGGAALVFLTTMKELPATLLLRPPGFTTLVSYIWTVQQAGYYAQAALPAVLLLVVSAGSMLVILASEQYDIGWGRM
jgi:iron(III) transport system permease protein